MAIAAPHLSPREAYRRWAPTYDEGNVLLMIDAWAVERLDPAPHLRHLDAACGTGRGLPASGEPARAIGVDLVFEMLEQGRRRRDETIPVAAADLAALPFPAASFDLVSCRLAMGYLTSPGTAYDEIARVCEPGGQVVVTDFHPEAARAGSVRTFKDGEGAEYVIQSSIHDADVHEREARRAGLAVTRRVDVEVGPHVEHFFRGAGAGKRYEKLRGSRVLLAFLFTRIDGAGRSA